MATMTTRRKRRTSPFFEESDEEPDMQIIVKCPYGETMTFDVEATYTITKAKSLIKTWTNMPIYEQRLIFNKVDLDGKYHTLRSYHISNRAELTLAARLSGGGKRGRKADSE